MVIYDLVKGQKGAKTMLYETKLLELTKDITVAVVNNPDFFINKTLKNKDKINDVTELIKKVHETLKNLK